MAVVRKQFHRHEKGNHDETFYYLARDTESRRVFIIHGWAAGKNVDEVELSVSDFLAQVNGTARDRFLELIGTLVEEPAS
ncbi:hypothetical protein FG93_04327 [Bosea sp. LC85]|uniref:hypothetical protein n=1 Tax=Bosea sp. LC85 TaxID=1502851 RepID=UPI0004E37C36|nr:hypothetical protein [Bosea sp. LC85]KFC66845.1 hypothetical protein FG93_04327 [Bosea sp. LC85]